MEELLNDAKVALFYNRNNDMEKEYSFVRLMPEDAVFLAEFIRSKL